jgi:thiol-disulfide isomerase/thioredoxin
VKARKKKNSTTTLWIVVGGLLAVVVAVAAIVAIAGGNDSKKVGPLSPDTEEFRPVKVTGTALPKMADSGDDAAVGLQAPQLDGASFDGTAVSIKPGEPTLVVLVAHWCPHCQKEVPRLVQWNKDGGVPEGVQIVGISTSANAQNPNWPPSAWLATEGFDWPVLVDSAKQEAAAAMGLSFFPTFVFLDAEGKVLFRTSGEVEMDKLHDMIVKALGT